MAKNRETMKRATAIAPLLCQLLILTLLSYGLDSSCLFSPDECAEESACCVNCNFPAHPDEVDHSVQIKLWPLFLSSTAPSFNAIEVQLGEVEAYLGIGPPPPLRSDLTDPVRGPPQATASRSTVVL